MIRGCRVTPQYGVKIIAFQRKDENFIVKKHFCNRKSCRQFGEAKTKYVSVATETKTLIVVFLCAINFYYRTFICTNGIYFTSYILSTSFTNHLVCMIYIYQILCYKPYIRSSNNIFIKEFLISMYVTFVIAYYL